MSGRTAIVMGEQLLAYDLGPTHPLRPERLKVALALMNSYGIGSSVDLLQPRTASPEELLLFHSEDYLSKVQEYSRRGYGFLDLGDTPAFKGCFEATSWVVGASLRAVEAIMADQVDHAFNLSGGLHHAYPDRASGFCIFNDPAICISFLKKNYGVKRTAYIDVDAHHGDGVMYGFYSDPSVLNVDLHEDGRCLFPGTGFHNEIGDGEAEGLKINVPLPPQTNDELYLEAFARTVPPSVRRYKPEVILFQSGADSHRDDPLTHLSITVRTYSEVATTLHRLAHEVCRGRILVFGGGGYRLANVARCWTSVLSAFTQTRLPTIIPADWREYYRSISGEEAPTVLFEPEERTNDETRHEVAKILSDLKKMTCIGE